MIAVISTTHDIYLILADLVTRIAYMAGPLILILNLF